MAFLAANEAKSEALYSFLAYLLSLIPVIE